MELWRRLCPSLIDDGGDCSRWIDVRRTMLMEIGGEDDEGGCGCEGGLVKGCFLLEG